MKKILLSGVIIIMSLISLVGCGRNKYNASLFDDAGGWIKEEFANDNLICGVYYEDMDFIADDSYPKARTFIVDNQEKYDQILLADITELDVNFEKQMLVVYTFTTIYHRKNSIKNLSVHNQTLNINYKMESKFGVGDASQPYQRWFVVKLDTLEITSVDFEEVN
ncbi:hypothetical protein [Bacteroides acidifaciens]|uniref:hypothetical protein n=1 Tax=Bacteroides acidifaciens TaxID=85831 RepID=UPI0025581FB1|nr:hypothetical protein [Bacteroides acidifaciens]